MKSILTLIAALLAISFAHAAPVISKTLPDGTPNRAVWMAKGTFGVMVHYLPKPPAGSRDERQAWVDRTVDAFDLAGFMRQFDATGADWLIFTLTQTNCVLTSANPVVPRMKRCW